MSEHIEDAITCDLLAQITQCPDWQHSLMDDPENAVCSPGQVTPTSAEHTHHVYTRPDKYGDASNIYHMIKRYASAEAAVAAWRKKKLEFSERSLGMGIAGPDYLIELRGVPEIEALRKQLPSRTHIAIYEGPTEEFKNFIRSSGNKELTQVHDNMFITNIIWVSGNEIHKIFVSRNFIYNTHDFKWSNRKAALRLLQHVLP